MTLDLALFTPVKTKHKEEKHTHVVYNIVVLLLQKDDIATKLVLTATQSYP